ncbi:MAG: L-rhamnose mutarotase [Mucilaginibacter sp.]
MERIAFKMKLNEGCAAEYKKRHDNIWPELCLLLKDSGVSDYSIFFDEDTHTLVAILKAEDAAILSEMPKSELTRRWWKHLSDIMESNADGSPVITPLTEIFYLP